MEELQQHCGEVAINVIQQVTENGDECHYNIVNISDNKSTKFFKAHTGSDPTSIYYCCDMEPNELSILDIADIVNYKCA